MFTGDPNPTWIEIFNNFAAQIAKKNPIQTSFKQPVHNSYLKSEARIDLVIVL